MAITNDFFFHVNIFRAKQLYVAYVTDALLNSQKKLTSEIDGGTVLAGVKAHRRLQTHVKPRGAASSNPEDLIHKLPLLRHADPLDVTVYLQRHSTLVDVGYNTFGGMNIYEPVLRRASDTVAKLTLSKCHFRHFSAIREGYSVEIDAQGDATLDLRDETFTSSYSYSY